MPTRAADFDPDTPAGLPPTGKYFVVMVAIDHYALPAWQLGNPVHDANNVLGVLRDRYDMGIPDTNQAKDLRDTDARYQTAPSPIWIYNSTQFKCLYNEAASKDAIKAHLKAVAEQIGPEDALLVYFAGHGKMDDDDRGYILAQNAQNNTDQIGWLPYEDLYIAYQNYLKTNKCRNLLLLLDCCHAGAALLDNAGGTETDPFSRKAIMSCGHDRKAFDGKPGEGSPFANALVKALADNQKPTISPETLTGIISPKVETQSAGSQTVEYGNLPVRLNGTGRFLFPLKGTIAQALPAKNLAQSLLRHLNFGPQKENFKQLFKLVKLHDVHLICTTAYHFDVQQLLRAVLFDYSQTFASINLQPGDPITIWPNTLPDGGFWEALRRSLDDQMASDKGKIVEHIVDRLQIDPAFKHKPFVIAVGFESGMEKAALELLAFAKELMDAVQAEKAKREHTVFAKLFLILSELTPGPTQVKIQEGFLLPEKPGIGLATVDAVKNNHIDDLEFEEWLGKAEPFIGDLSTQLAAQDFFTTDCTCYEVLSFIYKLADKLKIAPSEITENLGILKPA